MNPPLDFELGTVRLSYTSVAVENTHFSRILRGFFEGGT